MNHIKQLEGRIEEVAVGGTSNGVWESHQGTILDN